MEGSQKSEVWLTDYRPGGRHFRKKGEWTDDTLQAVAVTESLAEYGFFSEKNVIEKLSGAYILRPEWFGPTSTFFFDLVRAGTVPHRAAQIVHKKNRGSRTNGSVMRGFPLGIFYPARDVYAISMACSRITHFDPVAGHCSAFLNVMVSDMCRGVSRSGAFRHALMLCPDPEVHTVLGNYRHHAPVASLDSVCCSHAALYCFMESRSLEHAILSAVNLGGDTDTAGACCGALAGAYWGLNSVPARWKGDLEGFDRLIRLAEKLWECRADNLARTR